jgi:hypothetical protein
MKKNLLTRTIKTVIFTMTLLLIPSFTNAAGDDLEVDWFNITPKLKPSQVEKINEKIDLIWSHGWKVWDNYLRAAEDLTTSEQVASWIMNRNTILNYLTFVVEFLSQLWLLVWAGFIMYAWYKYMLSVFNWGKTPTSTLKNAIIWVIIVIFSYAIMRILISVIWLG